MDIPRSVSERRRSASSDDGICIYTSVRKSSRSLIGVGLDGFARQSKGINRESTYWFAQGNPEAADNTRQSNVKEAGKRHSIQIQREYILAKGIYTSKRE